MSDAATEERKSAGHTPGPWTAGRPDMATIVDGVESKWIYARDQYVAVASGRIEGDWHEVMANARLIAAAPELLKILKAALPMIPHGEWPEGRCEVCGWPLSTDLSSGCVKGNCAYRPDAQQERSTIQKQRLWLTALAVIAEAEGKA